MTTLTGVVQKHFTRVTFHPGTTTFFINQVTRSRSDFTLNLVIKFEYVYHQIVSTLSQFTKCYMLKTHTDWNHCKKCSQIFPNTVETVRPLCVCKYDKYMYFHMIQLQTDKTQLDLWLQELSGCVQLVFLCLITVEYNIRQMYPLTL